MSTKNSKNATNNKSLNIQIGDESQSMLKPARVESHDSNKDRVTDNRSANYN